MAAKTRELTAYGARKKKFLRRDFGDLEVQVGVRDVTSPIAVLGITFSSSQPWSQHINTTLELITAVKEDQTEQLVLNHWVVTFVSFNAF